jgi:hypothetical protein
MSRRSSREEARRAGTSLLIVGVALSITGVISIAALVVQLLGYDPACEPAVWSFEGACGALRLLVLLMLPVLAVGLVLVLGGLLLRRRDRPRLPG